MGTNNRQRRAAKVKHRARRPGPVTGDAGVSRRRDEPGGTVVSDWFFAAVVACQRDDNRSVSANVERLLAADRSIVATEIIVLLEHQVAHGWEVGWQPADVVRSVARVAGSDETSMLRRVIAAGAADYAELGTGVAPGWMSQLDQVGAAPTPGVDRASLLGDGGSWREALVVAVRLMAVLLRLPGLPRLTDPPSAWVDGAMVAEGSLPDGVLDKVRALLAKAESTTFDAEADAFTAKAQELMARHRIDRAVLDAERSGPSESPVGRRIEVPDPYADAKAALLAGIADANGCRSVWSKGLGFATVFGFADEIAAVDELYTSLLVQATAALRREGAKQDGSGRSRTTRFRRSFLVAFATRISQRLRETVEETVETASAETGSSLVPILAARDAETRAATEEAFPEVASFSPSVSDREGWYAGTIFGDQADLAVGPGLARNH